MQPQHHGTQESQFMDSLGDAMTRGNYSLVRWLFTIFTIVNTMLLAVFLRKNMGRKIARNGDWGFAISWLILLGFIAAFGASVDPETGRVNDTTSSVPLLFYHGVLYIVFSAWRRLGAWIDLRRSKTKAGSQRTDISIGDSVIYPFIHFFLKPIGLIDQEMVPKTLWKLNENRWMEIYEPLLVAAAGVTIHLWGYEVYGNMIVIGAICLFGQMFHAMNKTAQITKSAQEAKMYGRIAHPDKGDDETLYTVE